MGSEKGSSKTVQIIVGVIIVLLVVGGLVFYLIGRSKPETETSAPTTPTPTTVPPSSAAPDEGEALPSKDVMGTDLGIAPRSPGSVRVRYSKSSDGNVTKISYQTKDSVDQVKEYYYEELTSSGWQMTSSEGPQVKFEKEPARLYLWFSYDESDQITEYELKYFPE